MVNYLCTDARIGEIQWNSEHPEFSVIETDYGPDVTDYVQRRTGKKYIYAFNSYQGCGCGFYTGYYLDKNDPGKMEEYSKKMNDIKKLLEVIEKAMQTDNSPKLYECWIGEEYKEIIKEETIDIARIDVANFALEQNYIYTCKRGN